MSMGGARGGASGAGAAAGSADPTDRADDID